VFNMSVELELEILALRREMIALREALKKSPSQSNPAELKDVVDALRHTADVIRLIPALRRGNHHEIIELDLTKARNARLVWNAEVSWRGFPASSLTIFAVPSAFEYAVNAIGNKFLTASKGDVIVNEDIYRVYVTNAAGAGTGKIRLAGWLPPK